MNMPMHLLDHIDVTLLQELQDSLAASLGTAVALADPRGIPITAPSGRSHARKPGGAENAGPSLHPEVAPAVVVLFIAGERLGQWLVGGALPQDAPPDVQACVFMPMGMGREAAGFLGFEQGVIRDWPPEALAHFRALAGSLAENLTGNTTRRQWSLPPRFEPVYENPGLYPGIAS